MSSKFICTCNVRKLCKMQIRNMDIPVFYQTYMTARIHSLYLRCHYLYPCIMWPAIEKADSHSLQRPVWGRGTPLPPCPFTSSSFPLFTFPFLSLALPIFLFCPSLPLQPEQSHFDSRPEVVGGDRTWFQLFLFCTLCYLYSLVKMYCGALFYLVWCSFSALTLLVGSFDPKKPVPI